MIKLVTAILLHTIRHHLSYAEPFGEKVLSRWVPTCIIFEVLKLEIKVQKLNNINSRKI